MATPQEKLERKLLNSCRSSVHEKTKKQWLNRPPKPEEAQVSGGRSWRTAGNKVRVTRRELKRTKEEFHDSGFDGAERNVASQRAESDGCWKREAKASEDMVRQCNVMVQEELWSGMESG